ncbi:hypothetical protein V1273_002718 [Bradyrhizobium sp. AZCC 1721]
MAIAISAQSERSRRLSRGTRRCFDQSHDVTDKFLIVRHFPATNFDRILHFYSAVQPELHQTSGDAQHQAGRHVVSQESGLLRLLDERNGSLVQAARTRFAFFSRPIEQAPQVDAKRIRMLAPVPQVGPDGRRNRFDTECFLRDDIRDIGEEFSGGLLPNRVPEPVLALEMMVKQPLGDACPLRNVAHLGAVKSALRKFRPRRLKDGVASGLHLAD